MLLNCQELLFFPGAVPGRGREKSMDIRVLILMGGIFLFSLLLLWGEGLLRGRTAVLVSVGLLTAAFALRLLFLPHETLDYQNFLAEWVRYFRENGGFAALDRSIGNYNLPYLYFLALFSYSGIDDLYLIKLLSVAFDVLLAWGGLRIVSLFTPGEWQRRAVFLGILLLPTVLFNGAYWGQCDSIYTAFGLWAVYEALNRKPCLSVAFAAISFSFKLQAIFFLPAYFSLLLARRVRWYQLLVFPLVYLVMVLPAVLLGRPLLDTITLYFNQADSVGSALNYNSPSVYALLRISENTDMWAGLGIAAAFAFCCVLFYWMYQSRRRLGNGAILGLYLLFLIGVPFLLPHMHERYFFGADVLSFILCIMAPQYWPVPVLCSFASLLGYHAYLRGYFLFPMHYGAIALLAALIGVLCFMFSRLYGRASHAPDRIF